ncbi:MAG: hypothetical protein EOM68_02930 [Spirochaetia bacterium]|jgi:hypothetical protein|nr:hypothetical protein [Spirochaetia bacterium]
MMKKTLVLMLILLFCLSLFPLSSESLPSYEPYQENEFPLWTYKLRRAEILFFGSFVLTMGVASLTYSLAKSAGWVSPAKDDLTALFIQAGIASGLSLGIAVADYIIGEVEAP